MRYFYTYIPPCLRCGSEATGQYFYTMSIDGYEKRTASAMKRGMLVEYELGFYQPDLPNMYCSNCGIKWKGVITHKFLTKDEIKKEKEKRGIDNDVIYNTKRAKKISKKRMDEEKWEKTKEKISKKLKTLNPF